MNKKTLLSLLALTTILAASLASTRTLLHEKKKPVYAWLAFGREAKRRVKVCLQGEALSLEEFADGKSTARKDQFKSLDECKDVKFADPNGKTSYVITSLTNVGPQVGVAIELFVNVDIKGDVEYRQYCDISGLTEDDKKAPLAHFHGPLTAGPRTIAWKVPATLALQRGDKPTDLPALVGTMDAEKKCWVVVRSQVGDNKTAFPNGVHPFVDVEFPAKQPGAQPIKKRFPLDQFC